jgi:L-aspartate oxidase
VNRVDDVAVADVVVVGAGLAGLMAALTASPRAVTLLTKAPLGAGGASPWAQGGIAAAVGPDDSPALHAADTLAAGAGLCDAAVVDLLTRVGPARVAALARLGARFDRDRAGGLALGREAAHSRRRILHASGDATGAELVRALTAAVRAAPSVRTVERAFAADLVVAGGRVVGLLARHANGRVVLHVAPAVVLATGGIGRVYRHTTNPPEATGDGLAMAARAGARLADLEFVQFHPTALADGSDPMALITEALRGEGAVLLDEAGRRFMPEEHPDAELAPRDVVARAIWRRLEAGGRVVLDATAAEGQPCQGRPCLGDRFPERFPTVFALCRARGLDPRREPIPVSPAAHYHMGGIAVDSRGRASLPGLWACGEAAATGAHGANRLASNSLLEAVVFGARVAEDLRTAALDAPDEGRALRAAAHLAIAAAPRLAEAAHPAVEAARALMWREVGLVRTAEGLARAISELSRIEASLPPGASEARNLLTTAKLVAAAALARPESRGGHYRADHPAPDPRWQRHLTVAGAAAVGAL